MEGSSAADHGEDSDSIEESDSDGKKSKGGGGGGHMGAGDYDTDDGMDNYGDNGNDNGGLAGGIMISLPVIDPKVLEKPQVWGVFGDWKDLLDEEGLLLVKKYERELWEWCHDVDREASDCWEE